MSYQHILVPVDDSPISYAAVDHAITLAKLCHSQVTLVSVVSVDPYVGVDFYQVAPAITDHFMEAEASAKSRLQEIAQTFENEGITAQPKVFHGNPSEGIIHVADEVSADLIVMGSHGRTGVKKLVLGSVAQSVLTQSPIPVMVIKHQSS